MTTRELRASESGGQPLGRVAQTAMEAAFDSDFGGVRVHDDSTADRIGGALGARAFAWGQAIYFRTGEYRPDTTPGKALLAHELAHVVQDRGRATVVRLQRDPVPGSLTAIALEDLISSTLSRNVVAGDNEAALRRVHDVTAAMSRLNAHDSMVLHGRLLAGDDPLAVLFRARLARTTRARLLEQLLRQSARGGEASPASTRERDYFAGLSLRLPTWTVLLDPIAHEEEQIVIQVLSTVSQPDDLELVADWTVERVSSSGEVSEVTHFEVPWTPGMNIIPNYTIEWTETGTHYVTVRFRNEVGDTVHITRGSYFVTTVIPQTLAELEGHPQYVDSFTAANYDPDFRPDQRGHLSYLVGIDSADGWTYVDTRDVYNTGTDASGFHWRAGRIFPAEMNPKTTPGLVQLKRGVAEWMDEYNTQFIISAFVAGVFPILMQAPMSVGPMPAGGGGGLSRLRMPRAPTPPTAPPSVPGGGGGLQGGGSRTTVTSQTTILDADLAISLDRASQGLPLQPGLQTQAVASLGGTRVAATPTAVNQLTATQGGVAVTVPITRTVGTAAERAAITTDLATARVGGGAAGAADREVIAEAALAHVEPGVTPVFATGDRGIINKLAAMPGTGINTQRLGRYENIAEYLFYARGGARTFAVTIAGRPMIIRPIQPVRPGL